MVAAIGQANIFLFLEGAPIETACVANHWYNFASFQNMEDCREKPCYSS